MRKHLLIVLSLLLVIAMAGCGGKDFEGKFACNPDKPEPGTVELSIGI